MKPKGEPFFRGTKFTGTVSEALQWYRKNSTPGEQKQWVVDFLIAHNEDTRLPFTDDKPFPADVVDRAKAADPKACIGMGSVARLLTRGAPLPKPTIDRFHDQIRALQAKVKPPPAVKMVTPAALIKIYQHIDMTIDDISRVARPKLPVAEKWRETLPPDQRTQIAARYQKIYEEVLAAASEQDTELMEAYGHLNPRQMETLVDYLESLVVLKKKKAKT